MYATRANPAKCGVRFFWDIDYIDNNKYECRTGFRWSGMSNDVVSSVSAIDQVAKSASRHLARGEAEQALKKTRHLLKLGHATISLLEVDARAARDLGQIDASIQSMEKLIKEAGATLERALFYGDLLLRKHSWQAAADVFQQVIKQEQDNPDAWLGLGHALYGASDPSRAAECYKRVLSHQPENDDAATKLGSALSYLGNAAAAAAVLEPVHRRKPNSPEVAYLYADVLLQTSKPQGAIDLLLPHVESRGWEEKIKKALVRAWLITEKFDLAKGLVDEMLETRPDDVGALGFKAKLLVVEGRTAEARQIFENIMREQPDNYAVWESYVKVIDRPLTDEQLQRLEAHKEVARKREHRRQLASIHFAAYAHYSLTGDIEKEMEELNAANGIIDEVELFDAEDHFQRVKTSIAKYTAERISGLESECRNFRPVFILCPPRSGSTLLEQAIARHPAFWPGGEKDFAAQAWAGLTGDYNVNGDPLLHDTLDPDTVRRFAESYLEATESAAGTEKNRMIHKGINNYKFAGLLKAAFPQALFIDLRRNPMDVAFGCYRQNFVTQPFSFSFDGCASEVALFQETMDWWYEQMPESIYPIQYEALVEDFEGQLAALLEWLGEGWDPACLDFRRKSRVGTASANQVRKGLFKQGVGRWEKYRESLAPLVKAMEARGVKLGA